MDIEKRRADRLRVMKAIFDTSNGSETEVVRVVPQLQQSLSMSEQELIDACNFLIGEHLIDASIKADDLIIGVQITHRGIKEMEESLRAPSRPTEHFPAAVSVIEIHGDVIGSAVQGGSPGAQQEVTSGDLNLNAVRDFLREFDAKVEDLGLTGLAAAELKAEIDTVRAQLDSPKPKRHVILESLRSVRSILEITSGTAAAVGLLDLLKLIHL